jgi:hypothetical protein
MSTRQCVPPSPYTKLASTPHNTVTVGNAGQHGPSSMNLPAQQRPFLIYFRCPEQPSFPRQLLSVTAVHTANTSMAVLVDDAPVAPKARLLRGLVRHVSALSRSQMILRRTTSNEGYHDLAKRSPRHLCDHQQPVLCRSRIC